MSLINEVLREPEFRDQPLVLVDVGAAGGIHARWQRLAPWAIGVGFEPDARDSATLEHSSGHFRRWVLGRHLVAPHAANGTQLLYLTRSPQCSSMLPPRPEVLGRWAFAHLFSVERTADLPAKTLTHALAEQGIGHIDWLKCDTQGLDLAIYRSLPKAWREQMSLFECEPGLIDAYSGEDKVGEVLQAMEAEPFWLTEFTVGTAVKGSPERLEKALGRRGARWARQLGPTAPAWANLCFVRELASSGSAMTRRTLLVAWLCSTLIGQHGHALELAEHGRQHYGNSLFPRLARASTFRLRAAMLLNLPSSLWRRRRRSG